MMSHLLSEGMPKVLTLQLDAQGGVPSLVQAHCICQPLSTTSLWGSAHGLLALKHDGSDDLCLFCMNCGGDMWWLPPLPAGFSTGFVSDGIRTGGIFFNELPVMPFAILSQDNPLLHYEMLDLDAGLPPAWAVYPGTDALPVHSVAFPAGFRFVAVRRELLLVEPVGGQPGQNLMLVDIPANEGNDMVSWVNYGTHVFTCNGKTFICTMYRSLPNVNPVTASAAVFSLIHLADGGFILDQVYDIGPFVVYLGANQALVLPAIQESAIQRSNTIYIQDDNGVSRTAVVWSIDINSGEAFAIPFPPGVHIGDYGRAVWVSPSSELKVLSL